MKIRHVGSGLQLSYGNCFCVLSHGVLQPQPEGSCLGEIIPTVPHITLSKGSGCIGSEPGSPKPVWKNSDSDLHQDYGFFRQTLQGQKPSVAGSYIAQRSSDTEMSLYNWGLPRESLQHTSIHLQTTSKHLNPLQTHLNPPADTQRSETHWASPGMSSPWPDRPRMCYWLNLSLSLPLMQSRWPVLN